MPTPLYSTTVAGRDVQIVATDRSDGDVHPDRVRPEDLLDRQLRSTGRRWTMLDEVHGIDLVDVDASTTLHGAVTRGVGDVAVTDRPATHLAVWTADCAPVFLLADDGTVVGAHGGWRGLADGVLDVAVSAVRRSGGNVVGAVLGPSIGPCCYAFGADDLAAVAAGVHAHDAEIAGTTSVGERALDVPAAVQAALRHHDIELDAVGPCTGCDDRWFSHRVRNEPGRHATVAVIGG
ncbi:polyphenol oxidase family protein [Ilumatobacter nonamiensis]|uniref:polyphenol oxidase family protein n=1 Tax=Ilumatobacter nonamiensis TaxID=467093 RepID=UPI00068619DC|nr:polyphenol oxidase family protein [Ilumatobacter nonamiensis]